MKNLLTLLLLLNTMLVAKAQLSDCTPPQELIQYYDWDIKGLALDRMIATGHPGKNQVTIPQSVQDTIIEGMAAIINADFLPQRDSIFNMYCVHNNAFQPITTSIIIGVDESQSWTQHWQDLTTTTGEPLMDYITSTYGLEIASYSSFAVLETDKLWNVYALCDSLQLVNGVNFAEPNYLIGGAGKIDYDLRDGIQYYKFSFEWNDCFDGCDNRHSWDYRVHNGCVVEFTGTEDFGFFGIEPLPAPSNCNIITDIEDTPICHNQYHLFPNPAADNFTIKSINSGEELSVEIIHLSGQVIWEGSVSANTTVDVSNFPPGVYGVKIERGEIKKLLIL